MDALMDALGYVGSALEKPGRAVRGVIAGKGREALAALPFSDSLGLTDERDNTTGRDLTDRFGVTRRGDDSFGSHALGFGADMLTDPLNLLAGAGAYRAAPTVAKGLKAGAKAFTGLDILDSLRGAGAAGSRFAKGESGALLHPQHWGELSFRSAPESVNGRSFFHGTSNPHLSSANLDPGVTAPDGLFGPGIYTTDSPDIATGYANARSRRGGTPSLYEAKSGFNRILDLEHAAPPEVADAIVHTASRVDPEVRSAVTDVAKPGATTADLYTALRRGISDYSHAEGIPGHEFAEHLHMLSEAFRKQGIDALTHTGGLRTKAGQAHGPHQVVIGLDPNDYARVAPATPYKLFQHLGDPNEGNLLDRVKAGVKDIVPTPAGSVQAAVRQATEMRRPWMVKADDGGEALHRAFTNDPNFRDAPWYRAKVIANREGIPVRLGHQDLAPEAMAQFTPSHSGPGEIAINPHFGHEWDGPMPTWPGDIPPSPWTDPAQMDAFLKEHVGRGWFADAGRDGIIHHEVGHALHSAAKSPEDFLAMQDIALPHFEQDLLRKHLGEYATSNPLEAVAEIYAATKNKNALPRSVGDLFRQYAGSHMLDTMANRGLLRHVGLSGLGAAALGGQAGLYSGDARAN